MKCLDTDWDLTEGFSTWNRVLGCFLFYPFSSVLGTNISPSSDSSTPTSLPCFASSRQTLGLAQAIRSVQMRELFIWSDERENASKSLILCLSLSVDCGTDAAAGTPASLPLAGSDV